VKTAETTISRNTFRCKIQVLIQKRDKLSQMAHLLLDKEKIDAKDVEGLLGPRPSLNRKADVGEKNLKVVQG
jgi:ATP-dependent Zn protease